jgi:hypothetical protein
MGKRNSYVNIFHSCKQTDNCTAIDYRIEDSKVSSPTKSIVAVLALEFLFVISFYPPSYLNNMSLNHSNLDLSNINVEKSKLLTQNPNPFDRVYSAPNSLVK